MAYDIFISYRRDGGKELARPLKSELERRGYRVFLDFDELKDGVFDRRIMEAIDSAPIFMVVLSPHALDRCVNAGDWVRREIEYALDHSRHFIPVDPDRLFDGFPADLPESLKAGLGQHQFSEVMFGQLFMASVDKMVRDRIEPLLQQTGRAAAQEPAKTRLKLLSNADCRVSIDGEVRAEIAAGKLAFIPLAAGEYWLEAVGTAGDTADAIVRVVEMADRDRLERLEFGLLKTYKVGDYYDEKGKEGVVFEVDATGRHGKIVSLLETKLPVCRDRSVIDETPCDRLSNSDGAANLEIIKQIPDWEHRYPAFAWCAEQGKDWYLPAYRELDIVLSDLTINRKVNSTLNRLRAAQLPDNGGAAAWIYYHHSSVNKESINVYEADDCYVRPVAAF